MLLRIKPLAFLLFAPIIAFGGLTQTKSPDQLKYSDSDVPALKEGYSRLIVYRPKEATEMFRSIRVFLVDSTNKDNIGNLPPATKLYYDVKPSKIKLEVETRSLTDRYGTIELEVQPNETIYLKTNKKAGLINSRTIIGIPKSNEECKQYPWVTSVIIGVVSNNVPDQYEIIKGKKDVLENFKNGPQKTSSIIIMSIVYGLIITFLFNLPILIIAMTRRCSEKTQMETAGRGMTYMGVLFGTLFIITYIFNILPFWTGVFFFSGFLSFYIGSRFIVDSR